MEEKEIIGRMTCPICGEEMQDVKVNINKNLYVYCDNRCKFTLNPKMSKIATEQLRQGKSVKVKNIFIRPVTGASKKENYFFEEEEEF